MLSDRALQWLDDIRENVELALQFIVGHDEDTFEADKRTFYAAVRLEIISEASRRLPADMKARHPSIDWSRMAAARNAYRHGYGDIVPDRIWETIRVALPPLLVMVDVECSRLS